MTTSSDLENGRNRLVSKVLSCKNHPIQLELAAMAEQLQEAQVGPRPGECLRPTRASV